MRTLSFLIVFASTTFVTVTTASAQYQPEPNPANKPYVFLGGDKVKKGGVGVWGQIPMPPNAQVSDADIKDLVTWILTLKK